MAVLIDSSAVVSPLCDIEDSTRGTQIRIGPRTVIDALVKIKPAGGCGDLSIGADCVVNSGCVLYTGNGIKIGSNCAIAANCTFAPTNHAYHDASRPIRAQGFLPSRGGIIVEDDCWIGAGCVLLDGTVVRRGAVVGALSLVRGEVEAYSVHAGNPLRLVGRRS